MRSNKARIGLETLENRALLAGTVYFQEATSSVVVNDKVGTVDLALTSYVDPSLSVSPPVTVTVGTSGGTAVAGVDYQPVQQTFTLTPPSPDGNPPSVAQLTIPILPGPASLGTRVLQVSFSPASSAAYGTPNEYVVITHGSDTTSPYIMNSQALTQGGKVVAFALQFSKPMALGPVTNLANYEVVSPKSKLDIGDAMMSENRGLIYTHVIAMKSATYDASTNTVYLVPTKPVVPNQAAARLNLAFQVGSPITTSFSSLTDTSGNPIELDTDSQELGIFAQDPPVTKASTSVLSYLSLTPAHAATKPVAKATHKAK
jgi:hypothetical protein